jgi:glucarate dehydratase
MPIAKLSEADYLRKRRPEVTRRALMAGAAGVSGLTCLADMALAYSQAAGGTKRSGTPKADRPRSRMKISSVKVTRVASPDRPIMNSTSAHATHFVRTITEIETSDGHRGVSEVGRSHAENIEAARSVVLGRDPFEIEYFRRNIEDYEAFAGIEIACLDLIGRALNRRVCDLIGGAFREAAPYSAYVFFVLPTDDEVGMITAEAAAQQFVDFNNNEGFGSCKFKGGVLTPDEEIEALKSMRRRVPDAKLRIDPNAAWTVETSKRVAKEVEPLGMEYLEDPTRGQDGMAEVRKHTPIPLATNMCVTRPEHIGPAYRKGAIDIVLLDVHHMGGLNNVRHWAATCESLGWGCSGHSNNHLGISMATLTHMNCSISHVTYDADTHYPWTAADQDIVKGGKLRFRDGKMALPDGPGLGVEIDHDQMAKLEENVVRVQSRDALVDKWNPSYRRKEPGMFRF